MFVSNNRQDGKNIVIQGFVDYSYTGILLIFAGIWTINKIYGMIKRSRKEIIYNRW